MLAHELADAVRLRGHEVRVRGDEVVFRVCTQCANPNHNLEASSTKNVYHCWSCGASGRLADLLEGLGIQPPEDMEVALGESGDGASWTPPMAPDTVPLDTQPSAMAYLARRGVREAEARWLGITVQRDGPRVVIPVQEFWYGYPVGWVKRGYGPCPEPKYMNDVRCPNSLPGWRDEDCAVVCVVEGAFDALAVRRAGYAVAMLLGTGRTDAAVAWAAQIPRFSPDIVLVLDPEARDRAEELRCDLAALGGTVRVAGLEEADPADTPTDELRSHILEAT